MSRIALVTGANRGLGLEIARQLAQAGATVVIAARDGERGRQAAAELREDGLDVDALALDVLDVAGTRRAAGRLRERHGVLDVLVNNAGILPEASASPAAVLDVELFRQTFETNLLGAVNVTEQFLGLLRESDAGRIVNVSSRMGSLADQVDPRSPYHGVVVPAYQASKAALNSVTVGLSKLLADTGITVNAVCPGFARTDLTPANRAQAPLSAADAARVVVRYALAGAAGPTGGFFEEAGTVPW